MKTFIDNVARQVIERHMISPLPKAFCPTSIAQLSDEELLRIGSEPEYEAERRTKLNNTAQALKQSLIDGATTCILVLGFGVAFDDLAFGDVFWS